MECSECGNISTVLVEDEEGLVTPLCDDCYLKLKEKETTCHIDH